MGGQDMRPIPRVMREAAMRIMYLAGGLRWDIREPARKEKTGETRARVSNWIPAREGVALFTAWKRWGRMRIAG